MRMLETASNNVSDAAGDQNSAKYAAKTGAGGAKKGRYHDDAGDEEKTMQLQVIEHHREITAIRETLRISRPPC